MTADGRPRAWNSSLPARSAYMDRGTGLSRSRQPAPGDASSVPLRARDGNGRTGRPQAARRSQGRTEAQFSRRTRLAVRTRAGGGDPAQARCEADGVFLGLHAGDYQHLVARGMGGSRDPLLGTAANCALLCRRCHDLAESRDREMGARGFWLPQGTDPRMVPMMLASEHGSGVSVWRDVSGGYLFEAPAVAA